MLTLDFFNPTARPAFAALRGLLGRFLSPRYRNGFAFGPDYIASRAARTRGAAVVEVELYEDGSGVEVAAFGWWLLVGVELKRPAPAAARA